jgi:hypothetical protein
MTELFSSVGIALLTASLTLAVRYFVTRYTHSGTVRVSDAETIFQASESVRNDMAHELRATRQERDHLRDDLNECLEGKKHA